MGNPTVSTNFISTWGDSLIIGGLSILAFIVFLIFGDHMPALDVFSFAIIMAVFINGPHFLLSYLLFYRLARERIFREVPLFFVAFIVPLLILFLWGGAGIFAKTSYLVGTLYTMFFLVGWHYVRQGFGILMVYAAKDRNFFSAQERRVIKWSLYVLWLGSFVNIFSDGGVIKEYWGLRYAVPEIPQVLPKVFSALAIFSLLPITGVFLYRYKKGLKDNATGLVGLYVQYLWLLPALRHPQFLAVIPLFHSLQYLLFAGNVANNYEKLHHAGSPTKNTLLYWWGTAFLLAALGFEIVPKFLDSAIGAPAGLEMPHFYLVGFLLLINIHHYFIDAVLWRREFGLVSPYLKSRTDKILESQF